MSLSENLSVMQLDKHDEPDGRRRRRDDQTKVGHDGPRTNAMVAVASGSGLACHAVRGEGNGRAPGDDGP